MLVTRSYTALLVLALAAFACESKKPDGASPAPAANPTPNAAPEGAPKTAAPGSAINSFPAPAAFELVPLAVGQWVRMAVKTAGQPPMQTFVRIVGKEGDAFWYEIESNTPSGTTVIQFLMNEASRSNFSKSAIKKMKMRVGLGPVQEFSGATLAAAGVVADSYLSLLGKPNVDKADRADVKVPAGEFKGCYVHDIDQNVAEMSMKMKTWNHPAVPINGFVRSDGTINGVQSTTELYEMHLDGAKSALQ